MGKRIIPQRRGKGSVYTSPSHRHLGAVRHPKIGESKGQVIDLIHAPGRTAPLAQIKYDNGASVNMIAPEGIYVGQAVQMGQGAPIEVGNTLPLRMIPEGATVYNIESRPGDGGKYARAAGVGALIVSHGDKTIVKLPSERFKAINSNCMATVGMISGGGRTDKPLAKAGKNFHACRSIARRHKKVRGVAMNAVNHPHGGGRHQHVGRASTVSSNTPPGRKVGRLSPKKGKRKRIGRL